MRIASCLVGLALLASSVFAEDKKEPKDPKPGKANRLAKETSPYLLQHAHNPVDWFPWGEEAFAKAKKEGKLVFLSIGYSSCHWCHVMEKESFARADVAKILNDRFVCIKVDREERPEIDQIYMTALQTMDSGGGWPLSMFLTPEGKPIIGGTYFPREDREEDGRKIRGFKSVLTVVDETWIKSKKEVLEQGETVAKDTTRLLEGLARGVALFELNRELIEEAVNELLGSFDQTHGGFGEAARNFRGTKFPQPPRLMLLDEEAGRGSKNAARMMNITLDRMARGGIYDHVGGGFHRYSTERTWTVPHFEKMLYDNAQLVEIYAAAFGRTKKPAYEKVVRETLGFIEKELTAPEGGFYSALDADSEGEEGRFYVWKPAELEAALTVKEELDLIRKVYGEAGINFEGKYHILCLKRPFGEIAEDLKLTEQKLREKLEPILKKLHAVRSKREKPFLDTKVLAGWNGQMIAGYALAGQVMGEKKYLDAAAKAATFVLTKMRTKDGRLLRTYGAAPGGKAEARLNAYLDDYAYVVHGLLNLHDATKDKKWLDEAVKLTDLMIEHHGDAKSGGFYFTSNDHEKFFARGKDQHDGAQPSGNSMAARNLVRLSLLTKEKKYETTAEKSFKVMGLHLKNSPQSLCTLGSAVGLYLEGRKK